MKNYFFYLTVIIFFGGLLALNGCKKDEENPDQIAYDAADGIHGAILYDHVLNEKLINDTKMTSKPNFFRCKSCHGWDLKGRKGVLIDKKSSADYPVVADVELVKDTRVNDDIRQIYDFIANVGGRDPYSGTYDESMPDYSKILSPEDIWDLVKFIKETAHETDDFYTLTTTGTYPNGTKTFSDIGKGGNADAGLATYNAKCAGCHGADGSKIDIYCKGIWLGDMFRNDPHEIQHKAIWGMPIDREHIDPNVCGSEALQGGYMAPTGITDNDIRDMMVMGQDATKFPDYTPVK